MNDKFIEQKEYMFSKYGSILGNSATKELDKIIKNHREQ